MPFFAFFLAFATAASPTCADLVAALDFHVPGRPRVCGTSALAQAIEVAREHQLEDCLAAGLAARRLPPAPGPRKELPVARVGEEKAVRDGYYSGPHVHETANFVIQWGSDNWWVDPSDVEAFAEALEFSWDVEVGDLAFPAPYGTDVFKLNVYIADTGPEMPSTDPGVGGYQSSDADGFPFIVMSNSLSSRDWAAGAASHELFHAIHNGLQTLGSGWFAEASAVWIEGEVFPDNPGFADQLDAWALVPDLPLAFFKRIDGTDDVTSGRQYGSGVFLRHLAGGHGGVPFVRRSWMDAPRYGEPMAVLDTLLWQEGSSLAEVYADYAARSATWDFPDGELYAKVVADAQIWNADQSRRPIGTISDTTTGTWDPGEFGPSTFGSNYWVLDPSLPDAVVISFDGDPQADWSVTVATRAGDTHARTSIDLDGGSGSLRVADLHGADEAWLVISAMGPLDAVVLPYDYTLAVDAAEPVVGDDARHCGCDAQQGRGMASVMLLAGLVAGARRRRTAH